MSAFDSHLQSLLNGEEKDLWENIFDQIKSATRLSIFTQNFVINQDLYIKYYHKIQFENFDDVIKTHLTSLGYNVTRFAYENNDTITFSLVW